MLRRSELIGPPGQAVGRWWGAYAAIGWFASQVIGGLVYFYVLARFATSPATVAVATANTLVGRAGSLEDGAPLAALALLIVPVWAVQLGTVGLATKARGLRLGADLGVRFRPVDLVVGIAAGVGAQLMVGLLYSLFRVDADGPARTYTDKGSGLIGAVGLVVLLAVGAPLVEEMLFRGLLAGWARRRFGDWVSLAGTSLLFAAAHGQLVQFPGLVVAGLTFGFVAMRAGRLGPAIIAHVAFNATTVLYLLSQR